MLPQVQLMRPAAAWAVELFEHFRQADAMPRRHDERCRGSVIQIPRAAAAAGLRLATLAPAAGR